MITRALQSLTGVPLAAPCCMPQGVKAVLPAWGALLAVTGAGRVYLLKQVCHGTGNTRGWRVAYLALAPPVWLFSVHGCSIQSTATVKCTCWALCCAMPFTFLVRLMHPTISQVDLAAQLDVFFKRSLHKLALDVARAEGADATTIASIHQR